MNYKFHILRCIAIVAAVALAGDVHAQNPEPGAPANNESAVSDKAAKQANIRAKRMVSQAVGVIDSGDEQRGIGMLEAVPKMFPDSPVKYSAYLELGRVHLKKGRLDEALAQLRNVEQTRQPELQAESLILQSKVHLLAGRESEASMILRRIITDHPDSLFANDAWYEIGQIHFKGKRWFKAQEAFSRVGTSVPKGSETAAAAQENEAVFVEAGQRLYAVVEDRDIAVATKLGKKTQVLVTAKSGDNEILTLKPFGVNGSSAIASVPTVTEVSQPNDGKLTVQGGETVEILYVDNANAAGEHNLRLIAKMRIVSTAVLAVMDGAYRQTVKGVFVGNPAFLRLKDIDLDVSVKQDTVKVTVKSFRKRQKEENKVKDIISAEEEGDQYEQLATAEIVLKETSERNGIFEGRITPVSGSDAEAGQISAAHDGKLEFTYIDRRHIKGDSPREVTAEVVVLTGGSTEPKSIVSSASDPVMQCRKLLLEAKLLNQWGTIFKDVGLDKQASQKANEGLQRIDEIFSYSKRFAMPREIMENTYAAKWDLLMVKGELRRAISVCRELLRLYPDTILADLALLKIAKARGESKEEKDLHDAANIYRCILGMPNSRNKPEAQFLLAGTLEELAKIRAERLAYKFNDKKQTPDYTAAVSAYRACAENYPQSSFAGESFKRIVTFQIGKRDYERANETLERVFQDYPDAPWLDEMLLRWGIVKYRTGDIEGAKAKFRQILEEYPSGAASSQAQNFLQKLNR